MREKMTLESRFKRFVELNIEVQQQLQNTIENAVLGVMPDMFPFGAMKEQVKKEIEKNKKILRIWERRVRKEVLGELS